MKFKELIDKYSFADVWPVLLRLYPDQEKNRQGYAKAYEELRSLEPEDSDITVYVEWVENGGDSFYDVSGCNDEESRWALGCNPWTQWLGMGVDTELCGEPDTLAHCLWEMTFYGFTSDKSGENGLRLYTCFCCGGNADTEVDAGSVQINVCVSCYQRHERQFAYIEDHMNQIQEIVDTLKDTK
jgi:hypothetical protein